VKGVKKVQFLAQEYVDLHGQKDLSFE
jgi:hypothetical protein